MRSPTLRIDGSWVLGFHDGGHYLIADGSVAVRHNMIVYVGPRRRGATGAPGDRRPGNFVIDPVELRTRAEAVAVRIWAGYETYRRESAYLDDQAGPSYPYRTPDPVSPRPLSLQEER